MFCAIACSTWATDKYTIKIEPLKGEKWWGVFVGDAPKEPFLQPFSVNTAENSHSCSLVPMLISSAGRYLCSDYPIEVCFDGKSFTVSSEVEKPEVKRGGRTLREAYLVCYHRNFNKEAPQERNIPAELLSNLIYETEIEIG